jgi:hypothetical protein
VTADDFRPNVEKGARWLEEQGAWDWPDKILAAVEAAEFNMQLHCSCAVGTTLGTYWKFQRLTGSDDETAYACGFQVPLNASADDRLRMFDALEAAWIAYAREEQAARR